MRRIYKPGDDEFDLQLFGGSGAGLNYANKAFLNAAGTGPLVFSPVSGGGTIDSGAQMAEARHFSKWLIQLIEPTATGASSDALVGWSVLFYGTIDPRACNRQTLPTTSTVPSTSWCQIVAPSAEGGTPQWFNPILAYGQALYSPVPWVAIRCVATCTSSASGYFLVQAESVP